MTVRSAVQDPRRYFDAAAGSVSAQQAVGDESQAARSMLQMLARIDPAALAQPMLPPGLAAKVAPPLQLAALKPNG